MTQNEALAIMEDGRSVLLTGAAGSGKTFLLNRFIRSARKSGRTVAVTATTGLAATHLSGNTIHSWSGIGIHDYLPSGHGRQLSAKRQDTIRQADVLIIDEVSMLHDFRLDMVDDICREVREDDRPFGGLQVILCGDFFQLPPVNRNGGKQGGFVTGSSAWQMAGFEICYLTEQHRQTDDSGFSNLLNGLRQSDLSEDQLESLNARIGAELPFGVTPTRLHTVNVDVDAVNERELAGLTGEEKVFEMQSTGRAQYVEQLKKSCLAAEKLRLKIGALVMCIKNNPDNKYVNGSLGVVKSFEKDTGFPIVELTRHGRELTITPESWELMDGDDRRAQLTQLPLRLAWAITIHKSQGMTLDAADIDLGRAFAPGMGYVALSRVRSLDHLSLRGLNNTALMVSPEASELDDELQAASDTARIKYSDVLKQAEERWKVEAEAGPDEDKTDQTKSRSTWTERIEKMRQTYPNAYKPWTDGDDEMLKNLFRKGIKQSDLTKQFGRHPGSIKARLVKHFGEDLSVTGDPTAY